MPRILKLLLGQALLLLAVLVVAVLAAEWVVRKRMPELRYASERQQRPEDLFVRFDPHYGWSNIPGADVRFRRQDFDTRITINEQGFRGPAIGPGEGNGRRIAILGDSYVFGHGVEEEETFAALLREEWPGAEVGNFGVIGYSTDQELLLLRDEVLSLDPDLVILCLYRNDILDNGQATAWGLYRKPRFVMGEDGSLVLESDRLDEGFPLPMRLRRELRRRFVLYDVVAFRLAALRARGGEGISGSAADDATASEAERLTAELLIEASRLCQSRGTPLLVVVLPGITDRDWLDDIRWPGQGDLLDLGPIFSRYETSYPDSALGFTYDSHWNPRGHRLVADAIAARVEEKGWLPPDGDPSDPDPAEEAEPVPAGANGAEFEILSDGPEGGRP